MPRFAANLSMLYPEHEFLDRFAAAAADGFEAVEYLFPYDYPAQTLKQCLVENNLVQALFNAPPGDWAAGERGIASLPGRETEFRDGIQQALAYAEVLGNDRIHVMAGLLPSESLRAAHQAVYEANLAYAAAQAAKVGVTVLIEPINTRDMPGFFLNRQDQAQAIVNAVGAPNLKVQFDFYHCQIVEGDVSSTLRRDFSNIGHIQIASVPERHEPNLGELNYPNLFALIDQLGYSGWVGCEYRPKRGTSEGLGWLREWKAAQRG
ncbi:MULTISPECIES: 2-oxo-tetronate isomerase [unclassified Pseudomonas]|uniref:2-oxo-tetronate isomerase n=1 Tax=unclassified Pseudomonas TaxID=196821 RepID=UPI000BD574A5|nr:MULTISPECIES: 2-oxo-tetronate isomerase [unclassified Pseudomonas]PVZ19791.1 hydroxypyruvate isomerase [Pseudomonas sp. URIL14HWK12:I12]PVZ26857.1 hydroxypyruvate isomerase [Pseudomonas sp. URIL14HWK12:I10]PVZ37746.1 hydroxypyruvate isomerase [Pseudomonas sp. URIL14HWK12:I11]SNZ05834.1 hydroxypyruvate isomerase [Pseudomonas sp. URIL14HWK12:I9]